MKTSVYISFIAIILTGLGMALFPLFKDKRNVLAQPSTQAVQSIQINWGEGVDVSGWAPAPASNTPDGAQLAQK